MRTVRQNQGHIPIKLLISLSALIVIIAIYAPLIASDKPLFLTTESGWTFPVFSELFDRNFHESPVDLFFNCLAMLLPAFLLLYLLLKKIPSHYVLGLFSLIQIACFLFLLFHPQHLPYNDYRQIIKNSSPDIVVINPLIPFSQREIDLEQANPTPPSARHWLGTDPLGRDVTARLLFGMRVSLTIGLLSVAISITLGVLAGLLAGYMGGATDFVITRLLEVLICFPPFFLILTISIFLEQMTLVHIFLLIGLTSWPQVARLVRNEVLKVKNSDFILAARSQGIPKRQILLYHLLPNTFPPVLVTATFGIATAIMIEAALSFAGLGDPLLPSWGELLNNGRIEGKLWLVLPPGLCLFFLVSLCNLLGEALRRHFNPRNEEA